ncbi:cellular nucleic acid-binding protein-like [Medicago truncatula]|uniref:cellular nucleic acid-binding protein-like n=1 Tax=Medicago truncatula TaxID=3880 RepID=UPI001967F5BC|nr:cellular nucleic acid-binding protein-like [Medicago truncatula]
MAGRNDAAIAAAPEAVAQAVGHQPNANAGANAECKRKFKVQQSRPKPYSAPADKGKQRVNDERRPRKKDAPNEIVCYACGEKGHKSNACPGDVKRCLRCGKKGHTLAECKHDDVVCFNCNEEGHIGSQCKKRKKAQTTGRVFALTGTQTENEDCRSSKEKGILPKIFIGALYAALLLVVSEKVLGPK